ncbi:hypothetical protein SUGI_1201040 [Cryptomeria japonica]|nr:hypothetical protein SUGI_1201040 [Cryptomeria japonica]
MQSQPNDTVTQYQTVLAVQVKNCSLENKCSSNIQRVVLTADPQSEDGDFTNRRQFTMHKGSQQGDDSHIKKINTVILGSKRQWFSFVPGDRDIWQ